MSASTVIEAIERVRLKVVSGSIRLCQELREELVDHLDLLLQFLVEGDVEGFSAHLQQRAAMVRVLVAELAAEMRGAPLTTQSF